MRWTEYLIALVFVAAAGGAAKALQYFSTLPDPALVILTGVLCTAVRCGPGPSIFSAIASVLVYDFFFVPPVYTFTVAKPQDAVSLFVFLAVAVLTSNLTARLRNQAGILEEKAKTEAVIAASEDGLIVLDPGGVVVHANEVACAILEVTREETLGRRFDDLASRHPHYLRVCAAVADFLAQPEREGERVEITLFLRGRDHYFVLRPTPLQARDGSPGGLILALQDVTYLRDQEARREALVATLSHELRTPITSLGMAQELLVRDAKDLDAEQRGLLDTVREDVLRLQDVAQRLLDLSRGVIDEDVAATCQSGSSQVCINSESLDVAIGGNRQLALFLSGAGVPNHELLHATASVAIQKPRTCYQRGSRREHTGPYARIRPEHLT